MKFSAQCSCRPALKWSEGRQHILGFRATSHVDRGRKWDSIEVPRTAECLLCPNGSDLWRTRRKCRHGHQCCRPGTRTCTPKPAAYRPKTPLGRTPWPCQPTLGVPTGAVATQGPPPTTICSALDRDLGARTMAVYAVPESSDGRASGWVAGWVVSEQLVVVRSVMLVVARVS